MTAASPFDGTIVVVAPHMDDETLGCGLLLSQHPSKQSAHVVFATDGASSPVPGHGRGERSRDLAGIRKAEVLEALAVLGIPAANAHFLGLPDGELARYSTQLGAALIDRFSALRPKWVFVPFRYDRHPDHLTVNRVVCSASRSGALDSGIFEYFVYSQWRLLPAGDVRAYLAADDCIRLHADDGGARKRDALTRHRSQTTRLFDWQTRPVVTPQLIDRVCTEPEVLLRYDAARTGHRVLRRGRTWIPIAHLVEPALKHWKDRLAGVA